MAKRDRQRNRSQPMLLNLARQAWELYLSRRLTGDQAIHEPKWVHPMYQQIKSYLDNPATFRGKDRAEVEGLVRALSDKRVRHDDFFGIGRLVHEGWKVGTPTWVFLGRGSGHLSAFNDDLVICSRIIPQGLRPYLQSIDNCWEAWIAYSKTEPMGGTTLSANCYGPCLSREELLGVIGNGDLDKGNQ